MATSADAEAAPDATGTERPAATRFDAITSAGTTPAASTGGISPESLKAYFANMVRAVAFIDAGVALGAAEGAASASSDAPGMAAPRRPLAVGFYLSPREQ